MTGGYELKPPIALTCPACGGSLSETTADSLPYYICHIGHRFAANDLDEAQFRQMEGALEAALRALNERAALCERLEASARRRGAAHSAAQWEAARREAEERTQVLRRFLEKNWQRPDPNEEGAGPDQAAG